MRVDKTIMGNKRLFFISHYSTCSSCVPISFKMYKELFLCSSLMLNLCNSTQVNSPKLARFKLNSAHYGISCTIHLKLFNFNYQSVEIAESITLSNAESDNTFTQWSSNDTVVVYPVHTYFESCTINIIVILEDIKHESRERLEFYFARTMYLLTNSRKLSNYIIVRENLQGLSDIPRVAFLYPVQTYFHLLDSQSVYGSHYYFPNVLFNRNSNISQPFQPTDELSLSMFKHVSIGINFKTELKPYRIVCSLYCKHF